MRKLTSSDGVKLLTAPPASVSERRIPMKSGDPGCHLWVIDQSGIPYILEHALVTRPLQSGRVTHTNLTGGAPASCGGEIWFDPADEVLVYINGCSGRYGPDNSRKLEDAVEVVRQLGYNVPSFGWDSDADKPAKVLRR
ncbi:MAG TPA: hypothetical protein VM658_11845 [bacterium]|nr:hypothetical protein [bacterium]